MEVENKVIIITGASQGIGEATARLLADEGAKVVLAARSTKKLKTMESELEGSYAVTCDMRNGHDIRNLVHAVLKKYGRIDVLINNAGQGMFSSVEKVDIDHYREIMELNVYGYLLAMQAVIPAMRKQGGGMIVNISSMVTKAHYPNLAAYSSTKYAVNSLSMTARDELKKDNIIVSLVRPKLVETDFGKNSIVPEPDAIRDRANKSAPPMDTPEVVAEKILEIIKSEEAEINL